MSTIQSDKSDSRLSTPDTGTPFSQQIVQRHAEPMERMRRLIPYMTFYIPTSNADYHPYGHITKQMVIHTYE